MIREFQAELDFNPISASDKVVIKQAQFKQSVWIQVTAYRGESTWWESAIGQEDNVGGVIKLVYIKIRKIKRALKKLSFRIM